MTYSTGLFRVSMHIQYPFNVYSIFNVSIIWLNDSLWITYSHTLNLEMLSHLKIGSKCSLQGGALKAPTSRRSTTLRNLANLHIPLVFCNESSNLRLWTVPRMKCKLLNIEKKNPYEIKFYGLYWKYGQFIKFCLHII